MPVRGTQLPDEEAGPERRSAQGVRFHLPSLNRPAALESESPCALPSGGPCTRGTGFRAAFGLPGTRQRPPGDRHRLLVMSRAAVSECPGDTGAPGAAAQAAGRTPPHRGRKPDTQVSTGRGSPGPWGPVRPLDEGSAPGGSACPRPPCASHAPAPRQARSQRGPGVGLQCAFGGHNPACNPVLPLPLHRELDC